MGTTLELDFSNEIKKLLTSAMFPLIYLYVDDSINCVQCLHRL